MTHQIEPPVPDTDDPVAAVRNAALPESVGPLLEAYEAVLGGRDPYLWKWLAHLFPTFTLSTVEDRRRPQVQEAKFLASLFVTVADDLAEKHGDRSTFEEAGKIPFDRYAVDVERDGVDTDVVRYLEDVWAAFTDAITDSPRLAEFGDLLWFDLQQIVQAIRYTAIVSDHLEFVSEAGLWRHDVHNMMICFYADIDLVNAGAIEPTELATLREMVHRTQRMGRICNWLVTWERELSEGDPISGVVVRALETDIVSIDQLRALQRSPTGETVDPVVDAIRESDIEDQFLARWQREYDEAQQLAADIDSVDADAYLEAFEDILVYHVESRDLL
ncbi:hypothetical protein D8Y22_14170 [Salinadaptatus halalkaliphilus]|uniref:Uncharacterized protein n=1 Tax=Salinadaptatus halalkaliphilus TaxID=2419781 RepID=A0A4S3TME8_9EURY|nr:hypothetical protein [Salinadaptatus halalkaliphilus]THE64205.1 hypothetical protein D8Y22_14170 [Salinadaptatus halalkaliphilus]